MDQMASSFGHTGSGDRENNSYAETLRKRYIKAKELLHKIKQNARYRKRPIYDKKDRERCEKTIKEYREYIINEQKLKFAEARREREAQKRQEYRESSYTGNRKKSEIRTSSNSGRNELCMALVNEKLGNRQPVPASQWPMIETRISDILFKYLLNNKNGPIPRYDSGEIYRGYYLLQCHDKFSKEFLCNCMAQVKDVFEGLSLNVIEIDEIQNSNEHSLNTTNDGGKESSGNGAIEEYRRYLTSMDRLKFYAGLGQLTRNERKSLKRIKRFIREYEERNDLPRTPMDNIGNGEPQNVQGFQLSVNYGDSNSSCGLRQQMEDFSQGSWGHRSSSNQFPNDEQNSQNWGAWNSGQMQPESFPQTTGNFSNFKGEFPFNSENNYNTQMEPNWRPEFRGEQRSNSSWNFGDTQANDYQEIRGDRQDFDFNGRKYFDSESNQYNRPEMRGNNQGIETSMAANNNYETEQSWRQSQMANTAWKYDEPKGANYTSPNTQFMTTHFNQESQNSSQQLTSFAASSSRNMMANSSWNNPNPAERTQMINQEEPSKIQLEKQLFELLNALGANKPPVSQTQLQNARDSHSQNLGKRKSDLKATEVITLSDDSDHEEKVEKKAEMEYYKALAHLRKLEGRANENLTEQEKFFKETSEFIIKQYETKFCSKTKQTNNNQSQEKPNESQHNKKTRWNSSTNNNYAEPQSSESSNQLISYPNPALWKLSTNSNLPHVNNNSQLQIAIIDRNETDLKLNKRLWSQLEGDLFKALRYEVEKTNNNNIRQFDAKQWKNGFKIVKCENIQALDFIKRFIIKQKLLNPRQQYDVIPVSELPKQPVVRVWIPPPNADDMSILKILKDDNQALHSRSWTLKYSRKRPHNNGKDLYIYISTLAVEKLSSCQGEIRYGNKRLKMELLDE